MSDEEKKAIEYLKARLYGNEECKFIDVAQSDLRIFLKLVENLQKDNESWKDKIKAIIEELQEDIKYSANPLSIDNSKFAIKVLQSLLEKE